MVEPSSGGGMTGPYVIALGGSSRAGNGDDPIFGVWVESALCRGENAVVGEDRVECPPYSSGQWPNQARRGILFHPRLVLSFIRAAPAGGSAGNGSIRSPPSTIHSLRRPHKSGISCAEMTGNPRRNDGAEKGHWGGPVFCWFRGLSDPVRCPGPGRGVHEGRHPVPGVCGGVRSRPPSHTESSPLDAPGLRTRPLPSARGSRPSTAGERNRAGMSGPVSGAQPD